MNLASRIGASFLMGIAAKAMFMLGGGSISAQWFPQISHSFLSSLIFDPITAQAMFWLSWPVGLLAWAPLMPWKRIIGAIPAMIGITRQELTKLTARAAAPTSAPA